MLATGKVPLLVKIQTIDVESLDFRSSVAKTKLVTYVEGTNRFLFVGCTTGTVYVFSRDSQQFLFIIPFKGGKVCGISCAEDETDVAVGSLRGNVTIYRLKKLDTDVPYSAGLSPRPAQILVKPLFSVPHHKNNEITEMQWSPNGRYLFIGDTQGIISQVDVGSLEEFPRPPPSRVILQVQSRVLQLHCVFPYLAINTLAGVFLCDIENEDFTRIYSSDRRSVVKASGVCLVVHPPEIVKANDDTLSASLYVACQNTGNILRYGMQGNLLNTSEISTSSVCPFEVPLFDPKRAVVDLKSPNLSELNNDYKVSLGRLYASDDGYIISTSNHRISVLEPTTNQVKLILWNDEFRRISNVKVLSNYLFVWETGKLNVVALTYFATYGSQLLRANLHPVLENWIRHALNAVGWSEESKDISSEDEDPGDGYNPVQLFASVVSPLVAENELCSFLMSHVPSSLKGVLVKEIKSEDSFDSEESNGKGTPETAYTPSPTEIAIKKFASSLSEVVEQLENSTSSRSDALTTLWNATAEFYTDIDTQLPQHVDNEDEDAVIYKQSLFQSKMTIENLLQAATSFLKQPSLLSALMQLNEMYPEKQEVRRSLKIVLEALLQVFDDGEIIGGGKSIEKSAEPTLLIVKYGRQNFVSRWLKDLTLSPTEIEGDMYLAEVLLLLVPLSDWTDASYVSQLLQNCQRRVFSWLVILVATKVYQKFPFSAKLNEFLLSKKVQSNAVGEIISNIYEDLSCENEEDEPLAADYLHHFASILHFKSASKNSKNKILSALITHFPLKNQTEEAVKKIAFRLCDKNRMLVEMYKEACLTDGSSQSLCQCGLPSFFGTPRLFMIAKTQRILEEVLMEILFKSDRPGDSKLGFRFAMQRLLLDKYFQIVYEQPEEPTMDDDRLNLEIVFRSGQCHLLHKYIPFRASLLNICMELREELLERAGGREKCLQCGEALKTLPNFRAITLDCLGVWILDNAAGDGSKNNMNALLAVLRNTPKLNIPGSLSLRFYRHVVRLTCDNGEALDEESIDYETIARSRLHSTNNRISCVALLK